MALSFSARTKLELARVLPPRICCQEAELTGMVAVRPERRTELGFEIQTEKAAVARKILMLIQRVTGQRGTVTIRRSRQAGKHNLYRILVPARAVTEHILDHPCCRRSFLRGAFLLGGSVSDPGNAYHLEIATSKGDRVREMVAALQSFGLTAGIVTRKRRHLLYLKEGEGIADFLRLVGANQALLHMENVRVVKDMKNTINRLVNCDTANLNKTVEAALRQIEDIKRVQHRIGLDRLSPSLREAALARLAHPEASLQELGELMSPPVGKSALNHRFRRLRALAARL